MRSLISSLIRVMVYVLNGILYLYTVSQLYHFQEIYILATMKAIPVGMHGSLYFKNNLVTLEHHHQDISTFDTLNTKLTIIFIILPVLNCI